MPLTDSRVNPPAGIGEELTGVECLNCYEHVRAWGSELCPECINLDKNEGEVI